MFWMFVAKTAISFCIMFPIFLVIAMAAGRRR